MAAYEKKRGLIASPRRNSKSGAIARSHDQQIVRIEGHAGLDTCHCERRRRRSVGAEVERLVSGIEVEFRTEAGELVVGRGFEERRYVHACDQASTESVRRDRDVVV